MTELKRREVQMKVRGEQRMLKRQRNEGSRSKVWNNLPFYWDGDDLKTYLETVERSYQQVKLPKKEWAFHLWSRLAGTMSGA